MNISISDNMIKCKLDRSHFRHSSHYWRALIDLSEQNPKRPIAAYVDDHTVTIEMWKSKGVIDVDSLAIAQMRQFHSGYLLNGLLCS